MGGDVQQPMSDRDQAAALIRDVVPRYGPKITESDLQWIRNASLQLPSEAFQEVLEVVREEWPQLEDDKRAASSYKIALGGILSFREQTQPDLVEGLIQRIMNLEHCRSLGLYLAYYASSDLRQYWYEFAAAAQSEVDIDQSWLYLPCLALGLVWPPEQNLETLASELIAEYPRSVVEMGIHYWKEVWDDEEELRDYTYSAKIEAYLGLYFVAMELHSCTAWIRPNPDAGRLTEAQVIDELLDRRFCRDRELVRLIVKRIAEDPRLDPLALKLVRYMPFQEATSWLIAKEPRLGQWPDFAQSQHRWEASMRGL